MKQILITGATGNIGFEVIRFLSKLNNINNVVAGVRNINRAEDLFKNESIPKFVHFDFENPATFDHALDNIDRVFLLRPPHIADIEKYFKPLMEKIWDKGINEIVFLSVQGAEKSKVIPHNKIEKLIINSGIDYIFLRPSYFMQNLTTTLIDDIKNKRKIFLPAGKAKFNWVDVQNIGETAAILLDSFETYKNQAIDLTGYENMNFNQVANLISVSIQDRIKYDSANLFRFFWIKKNEGMPTGMILVMIMLHFLPRFQKEPAITDFYERLSGKKPTTLIEFIERENEKFIKLPS